MTFYWVLHEAIFTLHAGCRKGASVEAARIKSGFWAASLRISKSKEHLPAVAKLPGR